MKENADEDDYYESLVNVFKKYDEFEPMRQNGMEFAKRFTYEACAGNWLNLLTRSEHLYNIS